MYVIQYFKA